MNPQPCKVKVESPDGELWSLELVREVLSDEPLALRLCDKLETLAHRNENLEREVDLLQREVLALKQRAASRMVG